MASSSLVSQIIDIGERGAIDQGVEGERLEDAGDFAGLGEIDIRAGEGEDFVGRGPGAGKRGAEAAAGPQDRNFHGTSCSHHSRLARYQSMVAGRASSMRWSGFQPSSVRILEESMA